MYGIILMTSKEFTFFRVQATDTFLNFMKHAFHLGHEKLIKLSQFYNFQPIQNFYGIFSP